MDPRHISVLLDETIDGLALRAGDNVVDCTVGAGGHAEAALEKTAPSGRLIGFDLDEAALESARRNLSRFGSRAVLVRASYRDVERVLQSETFGPVQAALLDLGFSSIEIDDPARGFSFRADGPLDMRYDQTQDVSAATIVNSWGEDELSDLIHGFGEERWARQIAAAIVTARRVHRIVGTFQLVDVIAGAVSASYRQGTPHFATRTFQALRIAVNDELGSLEAVLPALTRVLAPGGRLAVISFHSLEDRIVKRFFRDEPSLEPKTKRPIEAGPEELARNPRARSAKLRIATKIIE
ncbi:MAG: hypothetical protein RLZZ324_510 [Candidatus Parcubacteria bacterium]|jgi:16S rRNA (cytosine1402-N4)-methyltransferase